MAYRLRRKKALQRKLHILRSLTNSKSVKKNSIIKDALLYIYKLNVKLEAIRREYSNLMAIKREYLNLINNVQEVKVEKIGEAFAVSVTCKKEGDMLVSILEELDKMGLNVLQARISCKCFFAMEAIAVPEAQKAMDVRDIRRSILEAIERQGQAKTDPKSLECLLDDHSM